VDADDEEAAVALARTEFTRAAVQAGLPAWPVASVDAISEADDASGNLE
jgi:hypothetical protein